MLNPDVLAQMVEQNEHKCEEGHARLRGDYRSLESRVISAETRLCAVDAQVKRIATEPTDVSRLNFPPRVVVSVVAASLTIAIGFWASTYGLRSDVRDILTQMTAQKDARVSDMRLIDERAATLAKTIDMIEKKQELQRLEIQNLRETVLRERNPR